MALAGWVVAITNFDLWARPPPPDQRLEPRLSGSSAGAWLCQHLWEQLSLQRADKKVPRRAGPIRP